ncbi:MAG: hypothetical protein JXB32_10080 [Deltaproteobacteria bacterium]|nr:hypothetical protein [Deltaproteobacteria bacterium]
MRQTTWGFPILAACAAFWLGACSESDRCIGVSCSGHGACYIELGFVLCHCDPGYVPDALQRCLPMNPADPCAGVTCLGHGMCHVEAGAPVCDCDPGYHPSTVDPRNCLPDPGDAIVPESREDGEPADDGEDAEEVEDLCGNGSLDPGEECDGGTQGCTGTCAWQTCQDDCTWGPCVEHSRSCDHCPSGECFNRRIQDDCGCAPYPCSGDCGLCIANCGREGGSSDPWSQPCSSPPDVCRYDILPEGTGFNCVCPTP